MKILSLYDGMACGMIAMLNAGVEIDSYDAYEIDKYCIQSATHNFPQIREHGDVFGADFTQYLGVDFLIGGSPCTHWSIAQTKDRETTVSRDEKGQILLHSSGIGFELFSQYLRALEEAQPRYFIYENNKSMSREIRQAISECFGFEPICINSALVSAQNRQRLYWVGRWNPDGYSKVNVLQPKDRGILLRDVLDRGGIAMNDKSHTVISSVGRTTYREYFIKNQNEMVAEPIITSEDNKSFALTSTYFKVGQGEGEVSHNYEKHQRTMVAEPIQPLTDSQMPYAIEFGKDENPVKAIGRDGKEITIYEVRDGQITIKGKQYPIKLKDGYYIIRKLTVSECKRLQTVPEWYEFPVSNSQAYKMLGNGWTCDVITHLIRTILEGENYDAESI